MGCGASKGNDGGATTGGKEQQRATKKGGEGYKEDGPGVPVNTTTTRAAEDDDPDLDNGAPSPLARKESAAVNASEPGDFVAKMKTAFQVRKAKFNGANEDVDQYMDEIRESIPVLAKRERARIQEWVNSIGDANPGDVFGEMPPEGTIGKRLSVASITGPGRESASGSAVGGAEGEPRSPLLPLGNYGKQSSSIGAIASENTVTGLASESEAGSPKKEDKSSHQQQQPQQLPGQVPEQTDDAGAVPLLQVTSAGSHRPDAEKRRSSSRRQSAVGSGGGGELGGTPDINALEAPSEGASAANPDDATQSHGGGGGGSDGSQVMEGGDFVFA